MEIALKFSNIFGKTVWYPVTVSVHILKEGEISSLYGHIKWPHFHTFLSLPAHLFFKLYYRQKIIQNFPILYSVFPKFECLDQLQSYFLLCYN